MGGELEKKTLEQHPDFQDIVKSEKNKKNKSKNKKEINILLQQTQLNPTTMLKGQVEVKRKKKNYK
jgi:hypothetical protein